MENRKGVSELVSYVLLIVIAVGLSVFVYNYLVAYAPKDKPTCNEDISLIVQDVSCNVGSPGEIDVTFLNKGLFKIDAAYVRFGNQSQTVKTQIGSNPDGSVGSNDIYLSTFVGQQNSNGLKPGDTIVKKYFLVPHLAPNAGDYGLEVEPAVFVGNELALCPNSIIEQPVTCN